MERERKSLEEKSMEVGGVMVSFRRAERVCRWSSVRRSVSSRGVGGVGRVVEVGRGGGGF